MKGIFSLGFVLVALQGVFTGVNAASSTEVKLSGGDVAKIVEGVIFGVLEEQFTDLDTCVTDVEDIASDAWTAI